MRGRDFCFRGEDWGLSSGFAGTVDRGLKCVCAFFFFSSIFVFFGLEKKFCRVEEKNLLFECSVLVFEKKFAGGARAGVVLFCDTWDFLGKVRIVGKCRRNSKYII